LLGLKLETFAVFAIAAVKMRGVKVKKSDPRIRYRISTSVPHLSVDRTRKQEELAGD
jgi:hypothetical protein